MRNRFIALCGIVIVLSTVRGGAAQLATHFEVNFDENGHGFIRPAPVGDPASLVSLGKGTDPVDPGNGLLPLIYNLAASPAFNGQIPVPGDIEVIEPALPNSPISDLLRFTPNGLLVVYSDLAETGEAPDLADVGIPSLRQPNHLTLIETGAEGAPNGVFGYTPLPNEPGFIVLPPFAGPVVYNFTSDVPEPGAMTFLGVICALLYRCRTRTR